MMVFIFKDFSHDSPSFPRISYNSPSFSSIRQACRIVYQLTLLATMEFSIKLHTIESRWLILYIEGSQDIILKKCISLSEN